jgi:hypothetical protein
MKVKMHYLQRLGEIKLWFDCNHFSKTEVILTLVAFIKNVGNCAMVNGVIYEFDSDHFII